MKCEQYREQLPDFWEGTLQDDARAGLEMHLAACSLCRTEADRLGTIWHGLGGLPVEQPSRGMRMRFYEKLESYQQGMSESDPLAARQGGLRAFLSWWSARPALQFGLAMATLAIGFAVGTAIDTKRDNSQLAQLRTEVVNMKQLVTLSLLQQQSASERLKGVNWANRIDQPDTEVLAALLYTVNHDPTVNVRLAAVDALRTFSDSPVARKGLQQAIYKQDSPLVQIAVIDQLADLRDRSAVPALQGLASDAKVNPAVRQRAQWALGRLQ